MASSSPASVSAPGSSVPPLETLPGAVPQTHLFKNRLQELAQKAGIPLPSYHTINGPGATYTSPNVFSHRKTAEMDVAGIAFLSLGHSRPQIWEQTCSLGQEDTIFWKQILNEYAVKINVQNPIYNTEKADGLFVSSLTFRQRQEQERVSTIACTYRDHVYLR